eukprot:Nk52_evm22s208 gene=Nk52_evmTU22s208
MDQEHLNPGHAGAVARPKKIGGGVNNEAYYKQHLEVVQKENKELKQQLDNIERQNRDLKRSVYELSMLNLSQMGKDRGEPFNIDKILGEIPAELVKEHNGSVSTLNPLDGREGKKDGRQFGYTCDLKGHSGAVYCVEFSPCGKLLASGSFDRTVKVWDTQLQREIMTFDKHRSNVSDVCWAHDSGELLTASFDQSVKVVDVNTNKQLSSHPVSGFVQSAKFHPVDPKFFFLGTSRNFLMMFDRRCPESSVHTIQNDCMVNALYVYRDGSLVLSGDSKGMMKTWDMRMQECFHQCPVDENPKPISSICVPRGDVGCEEEERFLGVNSYDNVLRVFDRGSMPPKSRLQCIQSLKGHKSKNFPIRSAFYKGPEHSTASMRSGVVDGQMDPLGKAGESAEEPVGPTSLSSSLLLATGSADNKTYIYNVGVASNPLLQVLEGHTDRVYGVDFHPREPLLATCSADNTVKLWSSKSKRL